MIEIDCDNYWLGGNQAAVAMPTQRMLVSATRTILFFFILFVVSITVNATIKTKIANTKVIYTGVTTQQLITETKMKFFGITKEEYARAEAYKSLMSEINRNNTFSTLETLGMFAETEAEKRKYARKFVKIYYQHTDKVLTFQKIINQEKVRTYGHQSMFDYIQAPKKELRSKRISKIINLNDCDNLCKADVKRLIKAAFIFPVDLYFRNATDLEIQQWALEMAIETDEVNQGFITLNHAY